MSKPNIAKDFKLVLRGLLKVANSGAEIRRAQCETVLKNSSLRKAALESPTTFKNIFPSDLQDVIQRASMIPVGIQQLASVASKNIITKNITKYAGAAANITSSSAASESATDEEDILIIREEDLEGNYAQALGVDLAQAYSYVDKLNDKGNAAIVSDAPLIKENINRSLRTASVDDQQQSSGTHTHSTASTFIKPPMTTTTRKPSNSSVKPLSKNKPTSQLGASSKQRKVPATRMSRLVSYGGLAAGLGIGALTEITKRSLGIANPNSSSSMLDSSPFLTEANAERIVDTLCRVRGAALKIGQILSIQDNALINPQLQKVFERVRHSADFMPDWQMEKMMVHELGDNWKEKLSEFESKPFAAASIGQVHLGKLHDGRPVAIKIQYPGVGEGINSDIDNLVSVLNIWSVIPEGVFINNIIDVAKRELAWEVDYIREGQCAKRFKKLLEPYPDYYVPEVIDDLTTKQVYTTELIEGMSVDKCESLDQETRDRICYLMLNLFFMELLEFKFMQTDANWSNFLYNVETQQVGLLDFGSSRDYKNSFVDLYMKILRAAAEADRDAVLLHSREIGFLSGYESKLMENAHTDTVMLLGEALRIGDKPYDFGSQNLTMRIQKLVPVMVKERICPPPEEIYSLHRKLSGIFLLCSRLRGRVNCREMFERLYGNYRFDQPD